MCGSSYRGGREFEFCYVREWRVFAREWLIIEFILGKEVSEDMGGGRGIAKIDWRIKELKIFMGWESCWFGELEEEN